MEEQHPASYHTTIDKMPSRSSRTRWTDRTHHTGRTENACFQLFWQLALSCKRSLLDMPKTTTPSTATRTRLVRSQKYKAPVVDDGIDSEEDGPGDFEPDGKTKPRDLIHMNGNEGKNEFSTTTRERQEM